MLWNWFTERLPFRIIGKQRSEYLLDLIAYLNGKYGDFDYSKDARVLDMAEEFSRTFHSIVSEITKAGTKSILVTGANSGAEVGHLIGSEVTAIDLSDVALDTLKARYPDVHTQIADMQALPFADETFDAYVSMRSIHASNLDTATALAESFRVTRRFLIYSISNGYNMEGTLLKGMYDYDRSEVDPNLPFQILDTVKQFLESKSCIYEVFEVPSEIIVFATKRSDNNNP